MQKIKHRNLGRISEAEKLARTPSQQPFFKYRRTEKKPVSK